MDIVSGLLHSQFHTSLAGAEDTIGVTPLLGPTVPIRVGPYIII